MNNARSFRSAQASEQARPRHVSSDTRTSGGALGAIWRPRWATETHPWMVSGSVDRVLLFLLMSTWLWCIPSAPQLLDGPAAVPHLPWPSRVRVPIGWSVRARDRSDHSTVMVTADGGTAVAVIDLCTREIIVSSEGARIEMRRLCRQQALRLAADRVRHEDATGFTRDPLLYQPGSESTWTDMQIRAVVTSSSWYPPLPERDTPEAWAHFQREATTMRRMFRRRRYAPAIAQRRARLRAARSLQGPARPARPGSAAG